MLSWDSLERELVAKFRHLGPLVLKDPKQKAEPPRSPLTFRVADVCHIGRDVKASRLTLLGVVNLRDHEYGREERRALALVEQQMSNTAKIRAMHKPAPVFTPAELQAARAALAAEFTVDELADLTVPDWSETELVALAVGA